jgi:3',5'-cyclic-AMP phosphodiesterase
MKRRQFIQNVSLATLIMVDGKVLKISDLGLFSKRNTQLRFMVASDGHYGQKDTPYQENFDKFVGHVNQIHEQNPFDFGVINGDIIHDNTDLLTAAKQSLDSLQMPYYVTQGNHDHATPTQWERIWGFPTNADVKMGKNVLLFGTTSNAEGKYLAPDMQWFTEKLREHRKAKNIFIFIHIPPIKWTQNAIDSPDFQALVKQCKNIRAIFHGHEHDQDGIKTQDSISYLFDSHFGGNWGTTYKGFRVVELLEDNTILTYIMNPTDKINEAKL